MGDLVYAPWSDEQIANLTSFQRCGQFHPFTCSGGGGPHSDHPDRPAVLIAERDGWRCPVEGCTHHQAWAFATMANHHWEPLTPEMPFGAADTRGWAGRLMAGDDNRGPLRDRLYCWRYRLICLGWRGRGPGQAPARGLWIGRHMIPLPSWFGTMDLP